MKYYKIFLFIILFYLIPIPLFSQVNVEIANGTLKINGKEITTKTTLSEIETFVGSKSTQSKNKYVGDNTFMFNEQGIIVSKIDLSTINGILMATTESNWPSKQIITLVFSNKANIIDKTKELFTGHLTINEITIDKTTKNIQADSLQLDTIKKYHNVLKVYYTAFYSDLIDISFGGGKEGTSWVTISLFDKPESLFYLNVFPPNKNKHEYIVMQKYLEMNPSGKYSIRAHQIMDSLETDAKKYDSLKVGMTVRDVYNCMQRNLLQPDEQLYYSVYGLDASIQQTTEQRITDLEQFINSASLNKELSVDFNFYELIKNVPINLKTYKLIFMNGILTNVPEINFPRQHFRFEITVNTMVDGSHRTMTVSTEQK